MKTLWFIVGMLTVIAGGYVASTRGFEVGDFIFVGLVMLITYICYTGRE